MNKILIILILVLFLVAITYELTMHSVQYALEDIQKSISDGGYKNFTQYLSEDVYQKLDDLKQNDSNVLFLIKNIKHTDFDYIVIQNYNNNHVTIQVKYDCKTLQSGSFIIILNRTSWNASWYIVDIYNHNMN